MSIDTVLHVDRSAKKFTIERVQDVEDIIEWNKKLRAESQKSDWGRHVAHIPNIFLEQWLNEAWASGNSHMRLFDDEFNKMVDRKIKDSEWAFLRVDAPESRVGWR